MNNDFILLLAFYIAEVYFFIVIIIACMKYMIDKLTQFQFIAYHIWVI